MPSPGHEPDVRAGFFSRIAFTLIRRLERALSPEALHRVIAPLIHARIAIKRGRPVHPLPACLRQDGKKFLSLNEKRCGDYFNRILEYFPDQLSTLKWRQRVEFFGHEHLESARKKRKPVVLAFCHFGPFFLLRYWLRAAGFPAATLIRGQAENRLSFKRLADRVSPFAEVPVAFYQDELRELVEFLQTGHPLLVALDVELGKQVAVALDEQWQVQVASGAIRLAIRHEAELIPCSITDQGCWRFRIKLGPPVPEEFLQPGREPEAVKQMVDTLLPEFRAHPEQCVERVINLFRPAGPSNNNQFVHADQIAAR
jgi:lauroyl/myristoyl acyltransferase